ncbi:MAG: hypothetical protein IKX51_02770, partial [Bacteroidales bacterium]|nr:hypothetical protein [Bacteroidales bacterium]
MAKKTETATKIVSLSETEGKKVVKIDQCELEDQLVFDYFKNNVKAADYDDSFKKALHIGVLALMEDRIQQFLVKTESDLGVELLNLKYKYDLHQAELKAGQTKGREGETDILTALNTFFQENKLNDEALPTGDKPRKGKNKTGDIVCYLKDEDGKDTEKTIGIESKFSSAVKLGDITSMTSKKTKTDTAWSQLLETDYNRDTNISMIVFDRSWADDSILEYTNDVRFIPQVGFIVIIDSQSGHFENLYIAYKLARDIAMNAQSEKYD